MHSRNKNTLQVLALHFPAWTTHFGWTPRLKYVPVLGLFSKDFARYVKSSCYAFDLYVLELNKEFARVEEITAEKGEKL